MVESPENNVDDCTDRIFYFFLEFIFFNVYILNLF